MTTPKEGISYVIPVYNEEKAIGGTIERLKIELDKTRIPFEIIVVNDGSKDDSVLVAKLIREFGWLAILLIADMELRLRVESG